jgi:hypothetical protein
VWCVEKRKAPYKDIKVVSPWLAGYEHCNEKLFVLVATVSASCWPWVFRRQLSTTTANCAVIVATHAGNIKVAALSWSVETVPFKVNLPP